MDAGGTKNKTHCCASCFCGIRRLPIFPGSAHMVAARCRRSGGLQLPVLEQLRFAASATGSAHRRCVSSQGVSRLVHSQARKDTLSSKTKEKHHAFAWCLSLVSGGYLSFRAVSSQVLSAYKGLTSVFGMGTGGSP